MAYNKTNWVNGETPINETNLNNIENGIEILQPNIMTASLTSGQTVSATSGTVLLDSSTKVGDKLTFSNNEIVIGTGVTKVKVSANMRISTSVANAIGVNLNVCKNGEVIASNRTSLGSKSYDGLTTAPCLIEVSVGDTICMQWWFSTSQSVTISGTTGSTYLTVEVVEMSDSEEETTE